MFIGRLSIVAFLSNHKMQMVINSISILMRPIIANPTVRQLIGILSNKVTTGNDYRNEWFAGRYDIDHALKECNSCETGDTLLVSKNAVELVYC